MRTIGQILKSARVRKKLSLAKVEEETKIKKNFIGAIEREDWKLLPEFPVVFGFVKNLASFLGIEESQALGILKRDYPPKAITPSPKGQVVTQFSWSPKLTFLAGGISVFLLVASYLIFQYTKFISPPDLIVTDPREGGVVRSQGAIKVLGRTDPNAAVTINNQPVIVEEDGEFASEIEVLEGEQELVVKATSRARKETLVRRKIKVER